METSYLCHMHPFKSPTADFPRLCAPRGLGVHFTSTSPEPLNQLLQGQLRIRLGITPQTTGASRCVNAAQIALLPGTHRTAAAARFAHNLRARLREHRASRLALRGAARTAEHHF